MARNSSSCASPVAASSSRSRRSVMPVTAECTMSRRAPPAQRLAATCAILVQLASVETLVPPNFRTIQAEGVRVTAGSFRHATSKAGERWGAAGRLASTARRRSPRERSQGLRRRAVEARRPAAPQRSPAFDVACLKEPAVTRTPSAWIVLKFGGTSVSTLANWTNIAHVAARRCAGGARLLIVHSAVTGITDRLERLLDAATGEAQEEEL